jgi:amino-acid N-acetyltransferase
MKPRDQTAHLQWFRSASPYINAHRGRTFVICFGGEALLEAQFHQLIHDIALLRSLDIKLVLVHGARPQIDARLQARGVQGRFSDGLRITDDLTLPAVKDAIGSVRVDIEALLSFGLPNSPMSGSQLRISSGNFVSAQPWGVHDGVDFLHTGTVRRVDAQSIRGQLELGQLVLLSPLGYSPTGETLNLRAENVACEAAVALHADKLIFLLEGHGVRDSRRRVVPQLSPGDADELLRGRRRLDEEARTFLEHAVQTSRRGVARVHLVSRRDVNALLQELFTRDGAGTLVAAEAPIELRTATVDDVAGVLALIAPLEESGTLVRRSREQLELEIANFSVVTKDGSVIACAALYPYTAEKIAEVACVAVHPDYAGERRGAHLLQHLEKRAAEAGLEQLFVLTTRTAHWFREQGFSVGNLADLPVGKRRLYNYRRNSKVFFKSLQ